MSAVVLLKITKELKKKMKGLKREINWPEKLRRFVETRIKETEARKNKELIKAKLKEANWSLPQGTSEALVRRDRDSH